MAINSGGRIPRYYHLYVGPGATERPYEFCVHNLIKISRKCLLGSQPDDDRSLSKKHTTDICLWIARRYTRIGFPDEFNRRINSSRIKDSLKKKGKRELFTGIYFLVEDRELEVSERYGLIVWATMREDDYANEQMRERANSLLNSIEDGLATCDGIDLGDIALKSEAEFTLSHVRMFKRWDVDDLSVRDGSEMPADD